MRWLGLFGLGVFVFLVFGLVRAGEEDVMLLAGGGAGEARLNSFQPSWLTAGAALRREPPPAASAMPYNLKPQFKRSPPSTTVVVCRDSAPAASKVSLSQVFSLHNRRSEKLAAEPFFLAGRGSGQNYNCSTRLSSLGYLSWKNVCLPRPVTLSGSRVEMELGPGFGRVAPYLDRPDPAGRGYLDALAAYMAKVQ